MEGDQNRIDELLKSVKGKDSLLDFNKIIPMPESLNIEAGSRTDNGLKAYKDFVYVYTFAGTEKKDLLNIPKEKEEIFLRTRQDIRRDEWELGKAAFQNEQKYGAATWYEWARENWGTKWSAYNAEIGEDNTIMFNTAWSRAMPVIQKLSENFPDLYFEYCWADEDLGVNVGMAEFETEKSPSTNSTTPIPMTHMSLPRICGISILRKKASFLMRKRGRMITAPTNRTKARKWNEVSF